MTYSRVDANQEEIVAALRQAGASVTSTADEKCGFPDIIVGYRGKNHLMEIKSEKGTLTRAQVKWHDAWRGQVAIVRSVDEALRVIGAIE